jgi:hypothetical protein
MGDSLRAQIDTHQSQRDAHNDSESHETKSKKLMAPNKTYAKERTIYDWSALHWQMTEHEAMPPSH